MRRRCFIWMRLWTLQHTIVVVTADGFDPGRKIKRNDRGESEGKSKPLSTDWTWCHNNPCYTLPQPQPDLHTNNMLTRGKSSAKPGTKPPKMRKINKFLAHRFSLQTVEFNSFYYRGTRTLWLSFAVTCDGTVLLLISHLLLICAQPVPSGFIGKQWRDAPPCTFHKSLLSCLMNLYNMYVLLWMLELSENATSPHCTPSFLICLECIIGCEVEHGAVLICANQVCGYGRDRCQPSVEGVVLNALSWDGECTILAVWWRLLELPVSCSSSQASF